MRFKRSFLWGVFFSVIFVFFYDVFSDMQHTELTILWQIFVELSFRRIHIGAAYTAQEHKILHLQ